MAKKTGRKSAAHPGPKRLVREAAPDFKPGTTGSDIRKASLFMNGRSQAVRLPKDFRFEGTHVYAKKEGNRVILTSVDDRWERFLAAFGSSPDFPDRDEPSAQTRPELDSWADAAD